MRFKSLRGLDAAAFDNNGESASDALFAVVGRGDKSGVKSSSRHFTLGISLFPAEKLDKETALNPTKLTKSSKDSRSSFLDYDLDGLLFEGCLVSGADSVFKTVVGAR